ncbi:MAG: hypothetical protein E6J56_02775 [Deltaproteobacteria bacterium]|nr:MAG: hypothetical protein E6J56_02775 [Deltaproteobacteria bacterium]
MTHATLWGLVAAALIGGALGWTVMASALAARLLSVAAIMRLLGEPDTVRWLGLVPPKDLVSSSVWLAAFLGRRVVWSGRVLRVGRDGRMVPVGRVETEIPVFAGERPELRAARG